MTFSKAGRKKYICDNCNRHFLNKGSLIKHMGVHRTVKLKKKSYQCVCGVTYCKDRLLTRHIRQTHFNLEGKQTSHASKRPNETWIERVLLSDVYVEITKLKSNLIAIRKCTKNDLEALTANKHTENKPKLENKSKTKIKDKLNMGWNIIERSDAECTTKDYFSKAICDYCNKEMLKKSLVSHIRERHTKQKRFNCEECGSNFNRRYQLIQHNCDWHKKRALTRKKRQLAMCEKK